MKPTNQDIVVGRWGARFLGRKFPCSIGRGGITNSKIEGDGCTPSGAFCLHRVHFRSDRIDAASYPMKCAPIRRWQIWCDDPGHKDYNKLADGRSGCDFSHERLARADKLYDLLVVVGYNWPNSVPNRGSAIFIHAWRSPRYPTAGCVAFDPADVDWIIRHLNRRSRLFVLPEMRRGQKRASVPSQR